MSRHRNVRSMNYSEECEGYDDVYGHSVEDDYCVSPSVAEQFLYDRSRRPQMSAFLGQEEEIAEEDEEEEVGAEEHERGMGGVPRRPVVSATKGLSGMDHARLQSCLEEVHNVIGDSIAEQTVVEAVICSDFNVEKALNMVLNNASEAEQSGALRTVKADQRKEKDVCSNCNSYSSPSGGSNACAISSSKGPVVPPAHGDCVGGICGVGVGSSDSSAGEIVLGAERGRCHCTLHLSEPPPSVGRPALLSSPPGGGGREAWSGCPGGTVVSTDCSQPDQAPRLHLPLDSEEEEEDASFPSFRSLIIHNTTNPGGVLSHGGSRRGGEKRPITVEWSRRTGMDLQVGTADDDSEDSMDEFSSLCSLVVHNRSERDPMPTQAPSFSVPTQAPSFSVPTQAPSFSVPTLCTQQMIGSKAAGPTRPQCLSDPSSEEDEDNFSLHSLVICNRSAPLDNEMSSVLSGQVPSLSTPTKAVSGSCVGDAGLLNDVVEGKDSNSEEEEDNYSSLCSLVIHNRSSHSEGPPKGSLPPASPRPKVALGGASGGELGSDGCARDSLVDRAHGGSFVIPPLLVIPKSQALFKGAHIGMGSEGSEEEEEDYVIDLCGTLKSMDVESISSAEESESLDVFDNVMHPSKVEDDGKKELKWQIMEEGWIREPVESMRLLDVNSRKLSPFGRVLCKNWECLKQLECPGKREAGIGTDALPFLFDIESPDDVCRRLRSQKYLVQVNAAKVTS